MDVCMNVCLFVGCCACVCIVCCMCVCELRVHVRVSAGARVCSLSLHDQRLYSSG